MRHRQISNRPVFKGVFHLFFAILYTLWLPIFRSLMPVSLKIPLTIYILSIIGNFGSSALFHFIDWPKRLILYPRRLDHVMIFVKIAATYYAAICTVLHDINPLVIYIIYIGTAVGIIIRVFFTKAPKIIIFIPYAIVGWAIILDINVIIQMFNRIPIGTIMAFIGGLSYTIGAFAYVNKSPNPWPGYIGYHELFHLFTIIGAVLFTGCIFGYAVPYYVSHK